MASRLARFNPIVEQQRQVESNAVSTGTAEAKVLVLYTGGTIGMLKSSKGYTPCRKPVNKMPRMLTMVCSWIFVRSVGTLTHKYVILGKANASLRSQPRFNDPSALMLTSHSYSVESYHSWQHSSGSSTPLGPDFPTLPVHTSTGLKHLPCLVSPRNHASQRTKCVIYEYDELIDSSEVELADYLKIAADIDRNYTAFDAFLVLFGTDTMAWAASSLSFLLQDLGKTVIITGAQIPLSELRNDAVDNLLGALSIARSFLIPEVTLFFNDRLYRGNRTQKTSSFAFHAFDSPNMPPLAVTGIDIDVRWDLVQPPSRIQPFTVHQSMNPNVARLSLYPSIGAHIVRAVLAAPTEGAVLETFGAGNCTHRAEIVDALREALERGVIIVNITQCPQGSVVDSYAAGSHLRELGVLTGLDMTVECAVAKLSYLLGRSDYTRQQIKDLLSRPLRGELTPLVAKKKVSLESQWLQEWKALVNAAADSSTPTSLSDNERRALGISMLPILVTRAAGQADGSLQDILTATQPSLDVLNGASSNYTHPPLLVATSAGIEANIRLLLEAGCSVHIPDPLTGMSVLFCAALCGNEDVVQLLKQAGAHFSTDEVQAGRVEFERRLAAQRGDDSAWRMALE